MLTITKKLDMSPHGVPQVIRVSQYDSDFTLEFKLFASGGNFAISTGTTAEIRGTKQSGTGYSASATLDTSTKVVTVAGAAQMTAVAGMNIFEIVLKKNNKEISSANFCLLVERAALDADTITDESVLKELNAIIEGAETATQAAEEAEDAADRAEAAAQLIGSAVTYTVQSYKTVVEKAQARNNINAQEALGVEYSENLFDSENVTLNKYFWSGDAITRELRDREGYFASGLIDVGDYDEITINGCEVIGAYQEDQTVISPSIQPQSTLFVPNTYTLDDSVKYIRVAGQIANIDSVYIRKPEFTIPKLTFTPEQAPDFNNVVRYDIEQAKTDAERTQARRNAGIPVDFVEVGVNLFEPASAVDGYGIWGDGANHAQEGRFASDYIDINDIQSVKVYRAAATYFYDVSRTLLSRGDPISSESVAQTYPVPANTKYVRITGTIENKYSATVIDASISKYKILDLVIEANQVSGLNEISVLFIGNSLTHDSVSYVPYILKTLFPEIKFTIHIFYNGGTTLASQYNRFVNNTAAANYSICDNSYTWKTYWNVYDMKTVLETYKFDVICMQDYFTFRSTFTEADLAGWNNCQAYIAANYKGGNPLKFVTLMPAPVRDNWTSQTHPTTAEVYAATVTAMRLIMKNTVAEAVIPCGYGIYKAMSTSLDELGDMGHLSHDGLHAQEGIPCLLQAYIVTLWILKELALPKSIYASPIRITTAIFDSLNVPGSNVGTGVITGTDAQNLLAQEMAIRSHKEVGWWDFTA